MKLNSWETYIRQFTIFFQLYYSAHAEQEKFQTLPEDLFNSKIAINKDGTIVRRKNYFGVKKPNGTGKKNRVIMSGHMDLFLMCIRAYDPMLELPVRLGCGAGLREGEMVNLTRASIKIRNTGVIDYIHPRVFIDLTRNASFSLKHTGKTPFGSIKRFRIQEVYPDFTDKIIDSYERHLALIDTIVEKKGITLGKDEDEPLLLDKWGHPMTVFSYTNRLKAVFQEQFVPTLERYAELSGSYESEYAYLKKYREDYPGAHAMRHWFSMYLITQTNKSAAEIAKWRGDRSLESYKEYVHKTIDMQEEFRACTFIYQKGIMEGFNE